MGSREITPLVLLAKDAYALQLSLGNTDLGEDFDSWRRAQCVAAVGKPGLSKCSSDHWRPLAAHFCLLAGLEVESFMHHLETGRASNTSNDTHERRRILAHQITTALANHQALASETHAQNPPDDLARIQAAVAAAGGPITTGYLVTIVRRKFRKPGFSVHNDLSAELAERLTCSQLEQLRSTIRSRISTREGRANPARRQSRHKPSQDPCEDHARTQQTCSGIRREC